MPENIEQKRVFQTFIYTYKLLNSKTDKLSILDVRMPVKAFRLSPLAHGVEPKTDILQHFGVQVFLIIVESHTGLN